MELAEISIQFASEDGEWSLPHDIESLLADHAKEMIKCYPFRILLYGHCGEPKGIKHIALPEQE